MSGKRERPAAEPGKEVRMDEVSVFFEDIEQLKKYRELGTIEELSKMEKEENILKFYYCENEDSDLLGLRIDTFY